MKEEAKTTIMSMILDLPKDVETAIALQARAAHMPTEEYLAQIVEHAVENRRRAAANQLRAHLDVMAASTTPETTAEQMESALEEALAAARPSRQW